MFNFEKDQADVDRHIQEVGLTFTHERTGTEINGVINRSSDDTARQFAEEIGAMDATGKALGMISFSHRGKILKGGDYLVRDNTRFTIHKIKKREYGDVLVRVRCLVEEHVY